jgi:nucleoside-diphosphate-sugar epimerase
MTVRVLVTGAGGTIGHHLVSSLKGEATGSGAST